MSLRGVWQLQKLIVSYCDWGGSSRGNKNERVVCVKNLTPDEIQLHATRLRNALGRKVIKLKTRHVTKHPSVQGTWTTALKL
ncbi:54S ribosomal protein L51 mitochondrial [Bienertia sinuspersici]